MHSIWQIQWTTNCLTMWPTLSKVKNLQLLFTLPRTLCSSQNNFLMRVTWLILIFSPLCLALFLKWPSDASLPNPTLLSHCSSFTLSRDWQKKFGQVIHSSPSFRTVVSLREPLTSLQLDMFSCFHFLRLFHICRFYQNYKVPFLGVTVRTFKIREAVTCSRTHSL